MSLFRLLAVTPPRASVEPGLVERWCDAAGDTPIAVLLRNPIDPLRAIARAGRLGPLAARARACGVPVLWSVDAATLLRVGLPSVGSEAVSLDGVQLRGDPCEAQVRAVRTQLGKLWLGRSVHGRPTGDLCEVDYSVLAPILTPRTSTPGRPPKTAAGLGALRAWAELAEPVFALGGVGAATARDCVRAGAAGLASIHAFFGDSTRVVDEVAAMAAALRR